METPAQKKMDLTIIMPALNEEANISAAFNDVINVAAKLQTIVEVIIINDGSNDKTAEIADDLQKNNPNVKVIHHQRSRGIGASYWEGFKASSGDAITWMPADGENNAYETLRYLPLLKHVDMLIPYVYNKEVRTWHRQVISKLYKGIINITFGTVLNYMNGVVIYRRCVLEDIELKSKGFFFQTELLIKSINNGYLYAEVPYALSMRHTGKSKALTIKSLFSVIRGYVAMFAAVYLTGYEKREVSPKSVTAKRRAEIMANGD